MVNIDIINTTREEVKQSDLRRFIEAGFNLFFPNYPDSYLEINFVSEAKIAELNRKYLKRSGPTDVISFPNANPDETPIKSLGAIVICPQYLKRHNEKVNDVVLHGLIHLAGYDHETNPEEWATILKRFN